MGGGHSKGDAAAASPEPGGAAAASPEQKRELPAAIIATEKRAAKAPRPLTDLDDFDRYMDAAANGATQLCVSDSIRTIVPPPAQEEGWIADSQRFLCWQTDSSSRMGKHCLWELCVPSVEELQTARISRLFLRQRLVTRVVARKADRLPADIVQLGTEGASHLLHINLACWRVSHLLHFEDKLRLLTAEVVFTPRGFVFQLRRDWHRLFLVDRTQLHVCFRCGRSRKQWNSLPFAGSRAALHRAGRGRTAAAPPGIAASL